MKKVYGLEDLDCASCANKMEREIFKLEGVKSASVNFMTQKLTLEVEDSEFERVMDKVVKVCKKIEPDCRIKR